MSNLIVLEENGTLHKLCRIMFGSDGSYYVTMPYFQRREAYIFKSTENYSKSEMLIYNESFIDSAEIDDENNALKLSHQPDGFLQFSGSGVISGKDSDGNIRGIGINSWELQNPASGPAFAITINGLALLEKHSGSHQGVCRFTTEQVALFSEPRAIHLEGYYFTSIMRRFKRFIDGEPYMSVVHPNSTVLQLKVIMPPKKAHLQGFIGLELYSMPSDEDQDVGFYLSGSTGNLRLNDQGEKLGDGIFCTFPRNFIAKRSLKWVPPE